MCVTSGRRKQTHGRSRDAHRAFDHGSCPPDGTSRKMCSDVSRAQLSTHPASPRCSSVPVGALALSFILDVLHRSYSARALPPVEIELSLYYRVVSAFWADHRREQSQAKLCVWGLRPGLCLLGRLKTALREKVGLCSLVQIWRSSHWLQCICAGFTLVLSRMAFGPLGCH